MTRGADAKAWCRCAWPSGLDPVAVTVVAAVCGQLAAIQKAIKCSNAGREVPFTSLPVLLPTCARTPPFPPCSPTDLHTPPPSLRQFEALIMSLVSGHPNIVETFKCLASWRDMGTEAAGELQAACNQGQVWKKYGSVEFAWHAQRRQYLWILYCSDAHYGHIYLTITLREGPRLSRLLAPHPLPPPLLPPSRERRAHWAWCATSGS